MREKGRGVMRGKELEVEVGVEKAIVWQLMNGRCGWFFELD